MWYTHVYPIINQRLESGLRHPFIEGSPAAIARLSGAYLPCFLAWNDRSGPWLLHYQGDSLPPELILELGAQCTDCKTLKKNVIELASGSYQHPSGQYVKNRYSNTTAES